MLRPVKLPEVALQGQNLFAARVSRNLFEQSWVGAIVTNGNPDGTGSNTLVGADARFATSKFRGTGMSRSTCSCSGRGQRVGSDDGARASA